MRRVGCILSAVVAIALFAGRGVCAEESRGEPATIDAKQMSFDRPANMAYGEGDVVIRYKGATLRADRVRYNMTTQETWADGNVRLNRGNEEWVSPAAYYNFDTGEFKADQVRGFIDPLIVTGHSIHQVGTNYYAFAKGTLTTCDYDPPHYRLQASHGEIWPGDRVVLYNVTVRVGNVPVFWFPMMTWSEKSDYPPLVLVLGYTSRSGFTALVSTYWHLNENLKLKVHVDERTRRGIGTGPDLHYRIGSTGEGMLGGYYIYDQRPNDADDIAGGRNNPNKRYRIHWDHKQAVTPDLDLTADVNKQSDIDFVDDFFHEEFRREREPGSVVDVTQRGPNHTLSLQARPELNDFFAEVERLPEAKLAVNRMRLGQTPVFYESETSAGHLNNEAGITGDPVFVGDTVRADTFHQLTLPRMLFGWLSVVPRAGARGTYYTRAPSSAPDSNEVRRIVYNTGMEASFKMSRTWENVRSSFWRVDGLRHIVQPFINQSWVPRPNVNTNDLFQFDTLRSVTLLSGDTLLSTRFSPLDFPAFNSIDAIDGHNTLRFGLRQALQTRRQGNTWNLVELVGWTDWRAQRDPGEREFSDVFGTLRVRPGDWIATEVNARYDATNNRVQELNTDTRVFQRDRWLVGVETRFLRDDSNLVGLRQNYRLTRHWSASLRHRVDLKDGHWEMQQYALQQETHDWLIEYGVAMRNQRSREDEVAVFIGFTLKAYPGLHLATGRLNVGAAE